MKWVEFGPGRVLTGTMFSAVMMMVGEVKLLSSTSLTEISHSATTREAGIALSGLWESRAAWGAFPVEYSSHSAPGVGAACSLPLLPLWLSAGGVSEM